MPPLDYTWRKSSTDSRDPDRTQSYAMISPELDFTCLYRRLLSTSKLLQEDRRLDQLASPKVTEAH
jgi:hypothetical protein